MTQYIKNADGKFHGSVGDGRDKVPTTASGLRALADRVEAGEDIAEMAQVLAVLRANHELPAEDDPAERTSLLPLTTTAVEDLTADWVCQDCEQVTAGCTCPGGPLYCTADLCSNPRGADYDDGLCDFCDQLADIVADTFGEFHHLCYDCQAEDDEDDEDDAAVGDEAPVPSRKLIDTFAAAGLLDEDLTSPAAPVEDDEECAGCSEQFPADAMTAVMGELWCEDCFDQLNDNGWRADEDDEVMGECDYCDTRYDIGDQSDHCAECGTCWEHCTCTSEERRILRYEGLGMTTSDAQAAVDADAYLAGQVTYLEGFTPQQRDGLEARIVSLLQFDPGSTAQERADRQRMLTALRSMKNQ